MKQRANLGAVIFLFAALATTVNAGREFTVKPGEQVVATDLIVRLKPGFAAASVIPAFLPNAQIDAMNLPNTYRIRVAGGVPAGMSTRIAAQASVDFVAPNRVMHTNVGTPNDTYYGQQWGLATVGALQAWSLMPAQYLTSATAGLNRVKVAILDTGVDCTHPDFINTGGSSTNVTGGGQINWAQSKAFVTTTVTHPSGCPFMDDDGHGTHVSGIVAAATSNATGVASLGYPLQVLMYKVLDENGNGDSATVANAITAAANANVQVISMSLGADGFDAPTQLAIDYAWQKNVVVVSAAGNSAASELIYPGDANLGLGISAIDSNNNLASFSSFGNGVALAAPGVQIISTFPTYTVSIGCCNYADLSGTSMATPFVSALAGLVAMATPGISNTAIVQQMEQTAASSTTGGGWNQDFGYGVINAYNAISGTVRPASVGGVVGQVIDTFTQLTSDPIDGAQVTINGQTVTTDTSGSGLFRIPNLPPGTYPVTAVAAGYPTLTLTVTIGPGADTPMIIAMGSSYGEFSGSVTDGGIAVPGAVVQALSGGLIVGVTIADAHGNYGLWVPGGTTTYNLQTSAAGRSTVVSAGVTVAVGGDTVVNLTLPQLGFITGTVQDGGGHFISGAQVLAVSSNGYSAAALTGIGGSYTLSGLPLGTYTLTASYTYLTPVSQSGVAVANDTVTHANLQFPGTLGTTATPMISPSGGTFTSGQAVTITTATAGASIRYTTDGSTPTETNGVLYESAIPIGSTTTVQAIAFLSGLLDSSVTSALFTINTGPPVWYNSAWLYRQEITIPATSGSVSLADFPLLVSLATDSNLATRAQPSGNDIVFTASDGITKLNHEIETYTTTTGALIAWVQVPVLSPGTAIYLYYGNAAAANQQVPAGVWDSNYKGVWHFSNSSGLSGNDSTSNGYNLTNANVVAAVGEVGGGASFNGTNAYFSNSALGITAGSPITVSFWNLVTAAQVQASSAFTIGGQDNLNRIQSHAPWSDQTLYWDYGNYSGPGRVSAPYGTNLGTWTLVELVYDAASTSHLIYLNGALASSTVSGNTPVANQTGIDIGMWTYGFAHASMDEFRVSNSARTAPWIATEYSNQSSPSSFISVGAQQSNGTSTVAITLASGPTGLALSADGTSCTAPCSFQWTAGTSHTIAVTTSPQAGAAGVQYAYASWSDGLAQSHSITVPSSATTYTASFTTQYQLTTSAGTGGTISPSSGTFYNAGTVVSVSATANSGFQFTGFSGALSGATTPQSLTMNAPATVTASFTSTSGPWYSTSWSNRKPVTISHTKISGSSSLTNFPVLISLASDTNLASLAQSSGNDILFTASDGVTKLNHEIESYTTTTGALIAWVQIPSLSPTSDTAIYMYYGNPSAVNQQTPAGVWDSNYKGVWHFSNSSGLTGSDSTTNGNTLTNHNVVAAAGEVGGGASFNGTNAYFSNSALGITAGSPITVSFWNFVTAAQVQASSAFNIGGQDSPNRIQSHAPWSDQNIYWDYGNVYAGGRVSTSYTSNLGSWTLVELVYDAASTSHLIYLNGALASAAVSGNTPVANQTGIDIGMWTYGFAHASMDEFRVSNSARTAPWIATEYSNQSSPSSFISVGAQQSNGTSTVAITLASGPTGLALSADGTSCTAPCSFQWTAGTSHTIAVTTSPQAGAAGVQYAYASWSDGLAQSHSITVPSSATTYTASFTTQYQLTTSAGTGGTISPSSGTFYNAGTVVSVSATANSGFQFTGFSGALSGATTPQSLTMNAPATVTASFTSTSGPWYSTSWSNRKPVTISHTKISGSSSLTNFPVLISLASDTNLASLAQSSGNDILFTASDGVTKLNHEIESYTTTTGALIAWVQIPSLSPTSDTAIYMYYGNPSAVNQQTPAGVWDSNYKGVWHFSNSSGLTGSDSTTNGNTLTNHNVVAAAGEVGGGASFNGTNAYFSNSALGITAGSPITVSFWNFVTAAQVQASSAFNIGGQDSPNRIQSHAPWSDQNIYWDYGNVYAGGRVSTSYTSNLGSWTLVELVYDAASTSHLIYLNGALASSAVSGNTPVANQTGIDIGMWTYGFAHASMDEFRVSNSARTAPWIATEYTNQNSPATFYSVGAQQ